MTERTIPEIAQKLADRAEEFCLDYLPQGSRAGDYWICADVDGGAGRSMAVRLNGYKVGKWNDHAESGPEAFGDLIDVIELQGRLSKGEAVKEAIAWLGLPEREPATSSTRSAGKRPKSDSARRLFERGHSIVGTPAETYLGSRGIAFGSPPSSLRYLATTYYREAEDETPREVPALLCAITTNDGEIVGVNRIYLTTVGTIADVADPKKVLGQLATNAVRFGGSSDQLVVGEGVETVLSVWNAVPEIVGCAALTARHLAAFEPPEDVRTLWIARDAGRAGDGAAEALAERMADKRPGVAVRHLKPIADDFNTRLQEMGRERFDRIIRARVGRATERTGTAA